MSSTVRTAEATGIARRSSPFQGLTYYSVEDSAYFFGRESERKIISANLRSSQLTLLYGPTGVGKSSLLRAGVERDLLTLAQKNLAARGDPEFAIAVFSGPWHGDVSAALDANLREAIEPLVELAVPDPPSPLTPLAEELRSLTNLLGGELLIVLDQFEEYFLYHGDESGEGTFDHEFPLAVGRPDLEVSFLVSIREDALSRLDRFKGRVPGLFDNYLRIDHLDREAARRAIEEPVKRFNAEQRAEQAPITVEPKLVDAVLDQVRTGRVVIGQTGRGADGSEAADRRIEAPHLQLVMERLWEEESRAGSTELRLATLEHLGGAEEIVLARGREVLDALPAAEQETLATIFDRLVTPSGSKVACAAADLAEWATQTEEALTPTLEKLCRGEARILRAVAPPPGAAGGTRYEIFHDVLASAILDWQARYEHHRAEQELAARLAAEEAERRKAEEQAARDRRNARRSRMLAAVAGLLLIVAAVVGVFVVLAKRDADTQRRNADTQRRNARAQQLAASATAELPIDPHVSLLLAREAIDVRHTLAAESALRSALAEDRVESVALLHPKDSIVRSAQLDSTGGRVATVSGLLVQIWATESGRLLASFSTPGEPPPPGAIRARAAGRFTSRSRSGDVRFSPHGKQIATVLGYIHLWDAKTGSLIASFRGPGATNVSFSPNERLLVTTHEDVVRLWDAHTGVVVRQLRSSVSQNDAEFSPDGERIVTAGGDGIARIWDAGSGALLVTMRGHLGPLERAVFSHSGKYVATASDDATARVWDASTGESLAQLIGHTGPVRDVSFSPGGKFVVTAGDTTARLWEPTQGRSLAVLRGHSDFVLSATFTADGRHVVTASSDGSVRVWNADPKVVMLSGHTDRVNSAAFNPDAGRVVTSSDDGTLRIWQSSTSRVVHVLPSMLTPPFVDAAYSDDGRRVAGVGLADVEVWDTRRARLLFGVENGSDDSGGVATDFSPDGKHFVAASTDHAAIWTMRPAPALINKRSRPLRGLVGPVHDVRYSRDGARIVTAGGDKTVRIWDATTGEQLRVIRGAAAFNAAAFSGNGKRIAAASVDGTVRMLAAGSGQELLVFRGHGGAVNDVNFSRDGRFLVTASDDKTARVWDARTGLMIAVLRGHTDSVRTAQFGPVVGNAIVTASRDGTARVYPRESFLPYEQIRAIADRRAAVPLTEEERREFERLRRE